MFLKKTITLLFAAALLAIGAKAQTTTNTTPQTAVDTNKKEEIPSFVEQMPEFPTGNEHLAEFLAQNIRYPAAAREDGIQGRVWVRFIVLEDGTISNAEVIKPVTGGLDKEALRVVNLMPKWKPGRQNGKPVKVYYKLPITFRLG